MMMKRLLILIIALTLGGCVGLPENVQPVDGFELNRYLGKWYEIARLDHSFERGLTRVTAEYSLREDGGVKVINRGFSASDNKWKEVTGKAYFVRERDEGYLKVSFFWPFYGSYIVFGLDKDNYQYAFISGPKKSYLWLLARTPKVDTRVLDLFMETSRQLGFDVDRLIFVDQGGT